jgi:tRNA(Ile)-lysidine synthase
MLRGEEADRDERFCKNLCEKYGAELFAKRADVASIAEKQRISTELCGRNLRYEFFEELAGKLNAKIATAHTASDNAETILFNMTRGAGLRGLSGITPVRGNIIRPLIYVTRAEVEDYCAER